MGGVVGVCATLALATPASAQEHRLTVTTNAGGSVTGGSFQNPSSIDCGPNSTGDCTDTYPPGIIDQTVQLTATALSGWAFGSWSGNCSSATTNQCNVTFFSNTNRTAGATFLDVTAPTVELTEPAADSIVRGHVLIRATAIDAETGIERVEFRVGGVLIGTRTTPNFDGTYTTSWDSRGEPDGNHFLRVQAYDNAGRLAWDDHNVRSDNTAPLVTVADPLDGSTVGGSVPIRAIAQDALAGVSRVDFFAMLPAPALGTTCPPGATSYHTPNVSLRDFAGLSPSGDWMLLMKNDSEDGDATLNGWSLEFGPPYTRFTSTDVPQTARAKDSPSDSADEASSRITVPPGMPPVSSVRVVGMTLTHDDPDGFRFQSLLHIPTQISEPLFAHVCDAGAPWTIANTGFSLDDGIFLGTDSTPPYTVQWDSTSVLNGSWGIGVHAVDALGNERRVAQSIVVNVDNSAPVGGSGGPALPPGCTIGGTDGNDVINGTSGNDVVCPGKGNDIVKGGGGNDVILLGAGNDKGYGGAGKDRIVGGKGKDRLFGGGGNDTLLAKDRVKKELVDGGPGKKDVCKMDRGDIKRRCP